MKKRGRPRYNDVLTLAEWRIVNAVRHGLSNAAIAKLRGVSLDAVKFHIENATAKLGLPNKAALRRWRGVHKQSPLLVLDSKQTLEPTMSALKLGPIGQISRSVKDIKIAEQWYGTVLGLPHLYTFGTLAFFDCGGTRLFLSQSQDEPGPESIVYLRVENIHAAYKELLARNVEFMGAPHMIHKHADGMEEWMCFFKDPEGRPLALMSQTKPA
jgi:DNA-binding CsgD family transcriptional regulator/predicted enzyme related to lactoylglutathione lyase